MLSDKSEEILNKATQSLIQAAYDYKLAVLESNHLIIEVGFAESLDTLLVVTNDVVERYGLSLPVLKININTCGGYQFIKDMEGVDPHLLIDLSINGKKTQITLFGGDIVPWQTRLGIEAPPEVKPTKKVEQNSKVIEVNFKNKSLH